MYVGWRVVLGGRRVAAMGEGKEESSFLVPKHHLIITCIQVFCS